MVNGAKRLPDGWTLKTVGELYDVIGGGTPSTAVPEYWEGDIPWITSADIAGLKDIQPRKQITEQAIANSATNLVPAGSLIVVTRVSLGKVALTSYPLCFSQDSQALIAKDGTVLPEYALYYLAQATQIFKYQGRGTTISGVTKKQLKELPFPLPPLPEQERIVAKIEELFTQLDAGTSTLERVQAGLRRYKASVLKAACEGKLVLQDEKEGLAKDLLSKVSREITKNKRRAGRLWGSGSVPEISAKERENIPQNWVWAKVRDLGIDPDDAVQVGPMSMQSRDFEDTGVPVLNVGCVQWGYFVESKLNYLPSNKAIEFERYRIKTGDVLFTRSGTVGRCAVARDRQDGWLMTFHLLRVRPDPEKCLPDYLQIVFEGATHIRKQTRDASIGTTRAGFNTNLLAMLDIPLPPLEEQRRIVAEVERRLSVARQIESAVEEALVRASRLRQAVLRSAFEGRLT